MNLKIQDSLEPEDSKEFWLFKKNRKRERSLV
jgi:hypothetical protein